MKTNIVSLTNMSILYASMHHNPVYHKPEIKDKPKKVEKTSKSNGGHFDARG